MFCKFCGRDIGDQPGMFCPFCGKKQDDSSEKTVDFQKSQGIMTSNGNDPGQMSNIQQSEMHTKFKMPKWLDRLLLIVAAAIILIILLAKCSNDDNKKTIKAQPAGNTVDKLSEFMTAYKMENGNIELKYNDSEEGEDWSIVISDVTSTVYIYDDEVAQIFIDYQGVDAFEKDHYFVYVFADDRASVYLDESLYGASIVSYMFLDDEIVLNAEGNHYSPSKDFEKYLRDSDVFRVMKKDIDRVERILEKHGVTYSDTTVLRKEDIKIVNEEDSVSKKKNSSNSTSSELSTITSDSNGSANTMYSEWNGKYSEGWFDTEIIFSCKGGNIESYTTCGYIEQWYRGNGWKGDLIYLSDGLFSWKETEIIEGDWKSPYQTGTFLIYLETEGNRKCLDFYDAVNGDFNVRFYME